MTRDEVKNKIVEIVTLKQGCKAIELGAALVEILTQDGDCDDFPIPDLIEELVQEEKLVEVEYVLPAMNYRIKSFLLPAGTEIKMRINVSTIEREE
jgi:hypothetical protein